MSLFATKLGGSASAISIYKIGYGLMGMTWTPAPTPEEQAFEAIKTAISCIPEDHKLFINSGEFYGVAPRNTAGLELVAKFFAKYPELADRCFLSVKGGLTPEYRGPDSRPESLRRSVDTILKVLDDKKSLDLFQCARVDPKVSIEDTYATLKQLHAEGKFAHLGISEVSAETLRKANAIVPIAAVEIEVSAWCYEEPAKKVIEIAKDLGIAVIAYSPLGQGFLTDKVKRDTIPEGDTRRHLAKFQNEAHNQKIVDALSTIAQKKGISNAQLALAWVSSLGPHVVPIPGSSNPVRIKENFSTGDIKLTEAELAEIFEAIDKNKPKGGRYFGGSEQAFLWR